MVYGGVGVGEQRGLEQLENENRQLEPLIADLSLDYESGPHTSPGWMTAVEHASATAVWAVD